MNLLNKFISNKEYNFIKFFGFSMKRTEMVSKIHMSKRNGEKIVWHGWAFSSYTHVTSMEHVENVHNQICNILLSKESYWETIKCY